MSDLHESTELAASRAWHACGRAAPRARPSVEQRGWQASRKANGLHDERLSANAAGRRVCERLRGESETAVMVTEGPAFVGAGCAHKQGLADAIERDLDAIDLPVLVVRGGHGTLIPERWAREVADRLPEGRLVVLPGTAHALPFSAAAQLAAVTRIFFDAPPRRRAGMPARG